MEPSLKIPKFDRLLAGNPDETLMTTLLKNQIPVASSCGGDGVCSKCVLQILKGKENLTTPTSLELDLLKKLNKEPSAFRISCQARTNGPIEVDTPYW